MKRFSLALLLALLLFAACGCAKENTAIEITPAPAAAETAAQTPAFTATPAPEQAPEETPHAAPTEAPQTPAASPTLSPSPSPTPGETPQSERVEIAEGFYYTELTQALKQRITGMSYPEDDTNSQISYADLRYIRLKYVDFEGAVHEDGELMVNKAVAKEVTEIFHALYLAGYPLASVRLVDDFGEPGDDNLSMAANNTSAFNYRRVTGSKTLSRHSYGLAVDINPLFNPYIREDGSVAPETAAPYADRTQDFPGKIDHGDLAYRLFTEAGWSWGGDWDDPDYQHFSKKLS